MLRLDHDLEFDLGCDANVCEESGGASVDCFATCRNFFVPRDDGDSHVPDPLRDTCSEAEAFDCLRSAAFDGSSAPIRASYEREGSAHASEVLVWAAPDGFLYVREASSILVCPRVFSARSTT